MSLNLLFAGIGVCFLALLLGLLGGGKGGLTVAIIALVFIFMFAGQISVRLNQDEKRKNRKHP
jgi:hypothetical protein